MEDYVTFEQAKKLKELGFNYETGYYYSGYDKQLHSRWLPDEFEYNEPQTPAPTLAQAQKWLREKGIIIEVYCFRSSFPIQLVWNFTIVDNEDKELITPDHANPFSTYEQALSAGIDKALELLK